MFNNNVKY